VLPDALAGLSTESRLSHLIPNQYSSVPLIQQQVLASPYRTMYSCRDTILALSDSGCILASYRHCGIAELPASVLHILSMFISWWEILTRGNFLPRGCFQKARPPPTRIARAPDRHRDSHQPIKAQKSATNVPPDFTCQNSCFTSSDLFCFV
jgi:hypothetical protein